MQRQMNMQQMAQQQAAAYNLAAIYARVHISAPQITVPPNPGAFLTALRTELDMIRKEMQDDLARQIFGQDADRWTWRIGAAMREIFV